MSVYVWGFGKLGQLGTGKKDNAVLPIELLLGKNGDRAARIQTGGLFTAVLTHKGDVAVCGCGKYGRLGTGSEDDVASPTKITPAKDAKVSQIASGSWHSCAVTFLGRLYSWGYNSKHNVLGRDCDLRCSLAPGLVPSLLNVRVKQVSCGHNFTLLSTTTGAVYSWGCGRYGVLGHGSEHCVLTPKQISSIAKVFITAVNAGYAHCGVIADDGRLFMFGKGADGALGFGPDDLSNKTEPTWLQTKGFISADVVDVSCSVGEHRGHTLALTRPGAVFAWGGNYKGKLGLGDQEQRSFPVRIPADSFEGQTVASVSAGGVHSGAITTDGRVFTWGCGKDGRLGHKEYQNKPSNYYSLKPKEVKVLSDIQTRTGKVARQISCSHYHTVVLLDYPDLQNGH